MEYKGRDANQILSNKLLPRSSWHFFQSKSWLDYSTRNMNYSSIQYAAFELRYGIEYLLFELLVLTKGDLTEMEYQKVLRKPDKMNKMLKANERPYEKLQTFSAIAISLDETLDINPLFDMKLSSIWKSWGVASEYLHFSGSYRDTFLSDNWKISSITKLEKEVNKFLGVTNLALFRPETMNRNVRDIWQDYLEDIISEESVKFRLNLIKPLNI